MIRKYESFIDKNGEKAISDKMISDINSILYILKDENIEVTVTEHHFYGSGYALAIDYKNSIIFPAIPNVGNEEEIALLHDACSEFFERLESICSGSGYYVHPLGVDITVFGYHFNKYLQILPLERRGCK